MTDKEKTNKLEIINLLRLNIGRCFDDQEHRFSSDKVSEKYAKDLLMIAFDEGVTLKEWEELILGFLFDCTDDSHIIIEQTKLTSMLYQNTGV